MERKEEQTEREERERREESDTEQHRSLQKRMMYGTQYGFQCLERLEGQAKSFPVVLSYWKGQKGFKKGTVM